MALIFNPDSRIIVVNPPDGKYYTPAFVTISGFTTSAYILASVFEVGVIHSAQRSLANDLYYHSLGVATQPMSIVGVCYAPDAQCGGGSSDTGANLLISWFDDHSAHSIYGLRSITISYGSNTIIGLLTNMKLSHKDQTVPLFNFVLSVIPLSVT